jgi:hypothetical protein
MAKDYIARYREKYPDDNFISDDDLINTPIYACFAFHESIVDFSSAISKAVNIDTEKINRFFKTIK